MDAVEILEHLIQFPTVSPPGNEEPAACYLAEILMDAGLHCQVQRLGDNRANLIAWLGEEGPELMLNGHLDVVPAPGEWASPPFSMTRKEGRLYGRGSADMKGGVAAMCEAAMRAAKKGIPRRGRLKLLFVADEECANLGALSYLREYEAPAYAIIGEPTDLEIAIAHRGVSRDYIDIKGLSRHAALPHTGMDAVEAAAAAVTAIGKLNRELSGTVHEVLPPPSIAVTMIKGYEKDNVVPGLVRLLLDFRVHPGTRHEQVETLLRNGLKEAGIEEFSLSPHFYMPGGEVPSASPFVQMGLAAREAVLGKGGGPIAFGASCEQCFLTERGTQAFICGPGSLEQAHTVNEFTTEEQVRRAVDLYETVIDKTIY